MNLGTLKTEQAFLIQSDYFVFLSSLGLTDSLFDLNQSERPLKNLSLENTVWQPIKKSNLSKRLTSPTKIVCVELNYRQHYLENGITTQPVFVTTLNTPCADVPLDSSLTKQLEYEVELAVIKHLRQRQYCPSLEAASCVGAAMLVDGGVTAR
jgi:2-keto-4-pentenoate hydratase/2-oxohepta-3-ene-1,7-dioic acid hydratase in catechol pathway